MRLSIGQKLTLAFGAALAILVATGIVASQSTRELAATIDHIASQHTVSGGGSQAIAEPSNVPAAIQREAAAAHVSARRTALVVRFGLVLAPS